MAFDIKYSETWVHFADLSPSDQVSTRDEQVVVSWFDPWITCCSFLLVSCCPWKASIIVLSTPVEFELLPLPSTPRQSHFFPSQTPHASEIDSFWQTVSTMLELKSQEQPDIGFIEKSYSRAWNTNSKLSEERALVTEHLHKVIGLRRNEADIGETSLEIEIIE